MAGDTFFLFHVLWSVLLAALSHRVYLQVTTYRVPIDNCLIYNYIHQSDIQVPTLSYQYDMIRYIKSTRWVDSGHSQIFEK